MWALTLVASAIVLVDLADGNWSRLGWTVSLQVWVLFWLWVVTATTRTVSFLEIARWWFVGFLAAVAIVYVIVKPLTWVVDEGNLLSAGIVPVVEELAKLAPLVVWVILGRRRGVEASVTDLAILGFAVGAGFAFHEDALRMRVVSDGVDMSVWGLLFPTFVRDALFVVGHAGWTMLAALGLGFFFVHQGKRLVWLAPVFTVGVAIADHAGANYRGDDTWIRSALLDGNLAAVLLLGLLIGALVNDGLVLRWVTIRDRGFPPVPISSQVFGLSSSGLSTSHAISRYRRYRNAAFFDLYRLRSIGRAPGDRLAQRRRLDSLRTQAEA